MPAAHDPRRITEFFFQVGRGSITHVRRARRLTVLDHNFLSVVLSCLDLFDVGVAFTVDAAENYIVGVVLCVRWRTRMTDTIRYQRTPPCEASPRHATAARSQPQATAAMPYPVCHGTWLLENCGANVCHSLVPSGRGFLRFRTSSPPSSSKNARSRRT